MKLLLLPLLLLASTSVASAQKRPINPRDLFRLRTVGDVAVSPDGRWVVYVQTSVDSATNRYIADLYAVTADGATKRRLTWTPTSNESSPAFSPDGKSLAFVARREGDERAAEIYVLPFTEPGESRRITTLARGVSAPVWSPDGRRIAFTSSDSVATDSTRSDPKVVTRIQYVGEQSLNAESWAQLYVVDASGERKAIKLTTGAFRKGVPRWTPDGRSLIYGANPAKGSYHNDYEEDTDLYILAADSGALPRRLNTVGTFDENPARFSPDGKQLAYVRRSIGEHQAAANPELVIANSDGSNGRCVTCALDRSVGNFAWDNQNRLYFTAGDRGSVHLYRVDINAKPTPVTTGVRGVLTFDISGNTIAWSEMSPQYPSDVYASDLDGKNVRRLTAINDSLLNTLAVQPYEEFWYPAADGVKLQGWIVRPPAGVTPHKRLAVEMHGGPHVMWGPGEASMWLEYQSLASDGYTVFFSNPRGSEGYGFEWKKAIHRNWGDLPMSDVLIGADSVIKRGLADNDKQYITGGSYAGYLTAWIIGHTDRFKAAAAQRGVYDMVSWWGMATTYRLFESEFAIKPWEDAGLAWKASPIAYADKIKTPLLLLHGEQDFRVGLGGVQTLFRMLKSQNKEVQLVLYPREGHEVTRSGEPKHRVDHMQRILNWFDSH